MNVEIKVPAIGESITEVQVAEWRASVGDTVVRDQVLLTIDSDKATVEISASAAGRLASILKPKGAMAKVGDVLGLIESGEALAITAGQPTSSTAPQDAGPASGSTIASEAARVMPAAARLLAQHQIQLESVTATGPGGRLLKEDVLRAIESPRPATPQPEAASAPATQPITAGPALAVDDGSEEVVPMSPLRRTVARRLVEAQHTMAILTTFNEVDLSAVMALRQENQEAFQARHGVKLGFMSFFVKAAIEALKRVPQLNAEVRGADMVFHHRYDIGVAIASTKGLVVPVLRAAERLGLAEIERAIADFAQRARDNQLKLEEIQGGTFTISNGGVFGSLLSTPIINPPQTGVLGMHTIQDRPVARGGQVVIRPMMYLALSYDHRIVDGREAVTFLKHVKDLIESPARILLEL